MASKGQKFNKYSIELKNEILNKYLEGKGTTRTLGQEYGISKGTIKTWIRKSKHPELASGLKQGRPRKDEIIDYKERYEILKKYQAFIEARHKTK